MLEQDKDWEVLPPELIQIIAKKLPDILDFIRFRATCKTWRFSAPLSDPPPLPWFLELLEGKYDRIDGSQSKRQQFYSVSSFHTLAICLTQSRSLWCRINMGVFSHYLPFIDIWEDTLSFFNPLTKDQFSIPWTRLPPYASWMIWTSTNPIRDRSIVVVDWNLSRLNERGKCACYDPHSNKWVHQEGYFYNTCYWQGMLYSTAAACTTEVFDTSSKKLLHKIRPPENELRNNDWFDKSDPACQLRESYIVESLGIILRVSWFYEYWNKNMVEDSIFHIYRLQFDGLDGQPCWARVDNIGNQILFLAEMNGFSMTARPSTGFRGGCIYFINPDDDKPYVHDILAGTVERVPCPFERCTWFLPGLC